MKTDMHDFAESPCNSGSVEVDGSIPFGSTLFQIKKARSNSASSLFLFAFGFIALCRPRIYANSCANFSPNIL